MRNIFFKTIMLSFILSALLGMRSLFAIEKPHLRKISELALDQAVQRALEKSPDIITARWDYELAEMSYDGAWETYYLPTVSLSGSSNSKFGFAKVPGNLSARNDIHEVNKGLGYPSSSVGLTIGSYTLFDGWKGSIEFENARTSWARAKESFETSKLTIRKRVTVAYYRTWSSQENIRAVQRSIQIASEVLKLLEAKKRLGQISEADLESVSNDLAQERSTLTELKGQYLTHYKELKVLLGEENQHIQYRLVTPLQYRPVRLSEKKILPIFLESNPELKNSERDLISAQRSFEMAELSNLPIPKVEISGITLAYKNNYYRNAWEPDSTTGGGYFDISTSVNLTFPFFGSDGFFNRRKLAAARISRDRAEFNYNNNLNTAKLNLSNDISQILLSQSNVKNVKERLNGALKILDAEVKTLTSSRSSAFSRVELRSAVRTASATELEYHERLLDHQTALFELALKLGLDGVDELYRLTNQINSTSPKNSGTTTVNPKVQENQTTPVSEEEEEEIEGVIGE